MNNKGRKFLSDLKLYSDFLGWRDENSRYETWPEAVTEVFDTHRLKYKDKLAQLKPYLDFAEEMYREQWFLASQRNLQFRGEDILSHEFRLYNCTVAYADKPSFLGNAFYLLLCGCGVGVNMMLPFVNRLPHIQARTKGIKTFVIPDTIEGWSEAAHILVSSYMVEEAADEEYEHYKGYQIKFDYSLIRPRGSKVGRRFKAPGHEGLKRAMDKIQTLLDSYVDNHPKPFKSILVYDTFMHLSDAVLTGGVRRSACSIIVSPEDKDLVYAKSGNWRETNPQRQRSNNSVGLIKGQFTKEQFLDLLRLNQGLSDIGFVFLNHIYENLNPCVTDSTIVNTSEGLRSVSSLVKKPFKAIIDGKEYNSKGFYCTGLQKTIRLKLKSGRSIELTPAHPIMTERGEWVRADDLKLGESIRISDNRNVRISIDKTSQDYQKGYLLGAFIGDGNISKNSAEVKFWGKDKEEYQEMVHEMLYGAGWLDSRHKKSESEQKPYVATYSRKLYQLAEEIGCININEKQLHPDVLLNSDSFLSGLICGYFDADGTVAVNKEKGNSIRLLSTQLENLEIVQLVLGRFGIYSTIYNNRLPAGYRNLPDGKGGMQEYSCKATHELSVTKEGIKRFSELIGFKNKEKNEKVENILSGYKREFYKTTFTDEVISMEVGDYTPVYDCSVEDIHAFDANGLYVHNCFEIGFTALMFDWDNLDIVKRIQASDITLLDKGIVRTAIQCCNLNEGNGAKCKTEEDLYNMVKAEAITGTLQAGYTNFKHLKGKNVLQDSIAVSQREALLGVSIAGFTNSPWLFNEEILKKAAQIAREANEELAPIIGINPAARITTVKPGGNGPIVLMCASGVTPEHANRYFRVMQLNKDTETAMYLEKNLPFLIEESVSNENGTDYVVFVPIENPEGTLLKDDLQGVEHLKKIKLIMDSWIKHGTVPERSIVPSTSHNVSNTVIIDDYDAITDYIYENQDSLRAVSFIGQFGDKDYNQSPNTSVLTAEEIMDRYGKGAMLASGLIVDGLHAFNDNLWDACKAVKDKEYELIGNRYVVFEKKEWVRRAKKFAKNYFKGDVQHMIYCLKDVHLFHKWQTINRQFKEIDFTKILTKPNYVQIDSIGAMACSGGSCEINRVA